jgi:hypothetical protein
MVRGRLVPAEQARDRAAIGGDLFRISVVVATLLMAPTSVNRSTTSKLSRSTMTALALLLGAAAALGSGTGAHAQQIRGRVVDEQSRSALVEATVTLQAVGDSTVIDRAGTTADGFFTVRAPGPGEYRIAVDRIGYAAVERTVRLGTQRELVVPAFVLRSEAIPLDPVTAEGRAGTQAAGVNVGFRRSSHLVTGEQLAKLEQVGATMDAAVRGLGAGLRVRDLRLRNWTRDLTCVELTRRMPSFRPHLEPAACNMVAIVLDGVTIPDPLNFYQHLSLREFESIEFVPAPEAGPLYGMEASAQGALVLWTRGRGPHRSPQRNGGGTEP